MAEPVLDKPLFFIHVMKTAGTTVTAAFRDAFGPGEIFPNADDDGDLLAAMTNVAAAMLTMDWVVRRQARRPVTARRLDVVTLG